MRRALIDAEGVTQNIIEIEEGANYTVPKGWRLDDPDLYPMPEPEPVDDPPPPSLAVIAKLKGALQDLEAAGFLPEGTADKL